MHNLISYKLTLQSSVTGGHLDSLKSTILRLGIFDSDSDFGLGLKTQKVL